MLLFFWNLHLFMAKMPIYCSFSYCWRWRWRWWWRWFRLWHMFDFWNCENRYIRPDDLSPLVANSSTILPLCSIVRRLHIKSKFVCVCFCKCLQVIVMFRRLACGAELYRLWNSGSILPRTWMASSTPARVPMRHYSVASMRQSVWMYYVSSNQIWKDQKAKILWRI